VATKKKAVCRLHVGGEQHTRKRRWGAKDKTIRFFREMACSGEGTLKRKQTNKGKDLQRGVGKREEGGCPAPNYCYTLKTGK